MNYFIGNWPLHSSHTYMGSMAQEHRMNVFANNLANVATPGFKKDVPVFDGYQVKNTSIYWGQGSINHTGNKFDLALHGPGFFQVETPDGVRYTRNGTFTVNSEGEVVNKDGYPVLGAGVIPDGTVQVDILEDGRVLADNQQIGQIEIVEFEDRRILAKAGKSNFVPKVPGAAGLPAEKTSIQQGYIEMSNADPVMGSVNLIDTIRTYEIYQKVALSFQEADTKSVNEVGRLV